MTEPNFLDMISGSEFPASQTRDIIALCFLLTRIRNLSHSSEPDSARILTIIEKDIHKEIDYLISTYGSQKFLLTTKKFNKNIKYKIEMLSKILPGAQKFCVIMEEMRNVTNSLIASEYAKGN